MPDEKDIRRLVDAELAKVSDPARKNSLRGLLVAPKPLSLGWDYGRPGEKCECWLVGVSPSGKERIVYCVKGFGPADPWGLVGAHEDSSGMDCQWFARLEDAAIHAKILPPPSNYEVP